VTGIEQESSSMNAARVEHAETARAESRRRINISGVLVDPLMYKEALIRMEAFLHEDCFHYTVTCNLDFLRHARKNRAFRAALAGAHMVTADGAPLLWLSRCSGEPLPERVTGSDLLPALLRIAGKRHLRVFFLGGRNKDALGAVRAAQHLAPGIAIVGVDTCWVDLQDKDACLRTASKVAGRSPDIVLVCLGSPKAELFLARYGYLLGCRLAISIGAGLAFLAGTKARGPKFFREHGIEWLYRLCQEPRRLGGRYFVDALCLARLFIAAFWQRLSHTRQRRSLCRTQPAP